MCFDCVQFCVQSRILDHKIRYMLNYTVRLCTLFHGVSDLKQNYMEVDLKKLGSPVLFRDPPKRVADVPFRKSARRIFFIFRLKEA